MKSENDVPIPEPSTRAEEGADSSSSPDDRRVHPEAPPATAHEIARRQLLGKMSVGLGVVCGGAISLPGIGFVVAPILREAPRAWDPVGKVDQFKVGETVNVVFVDASPLPWAGVTARSSAWLRRVDTNTFIAFSVNCAHLGCPVRWMADARLFMCPCHGGVYYEDGTVAAGPPPHPLTRYPARVQNGYVAIRTDPIPIG
jgi:menaquinol-cytochrome c reductase iron-sulfur subunit